MTQWPKETLESALRSGLSAKVVLNVTTPEGANRLYWALVRRRKALGIVGVAMCTSGHTVVLTPAKSVEIITLHVEDAPPPPLPTESPDAP